VSLSYDKGDNPTGWSVTNCTGQSLPTFCNQSATGTFNAGSELMGWTKTNTSTNTTLANLALTFNPQGDRTQQTDSVANTTASFGYDASDMLTSYAKGSTSASYLHDADGLRVAKTVNGTSTYFAWDLAEGMPRIVSISGANGTNVQDYLYRADGVPMEQYVSSTNATFYAHDQLGSIRAAYPSNSTTPTGLVGYDYYGNVIYSWGTSTGPFGYGGQYQDAESGLLYLRARMYDPSTQQFLSVDPLVGITGEPYSYAGNDPINQGDPSGLLGVMCIGGHGAGCAPASHPSPVAVVGTFIGVGGLACAVIEPCGGAAAAAVVVGAPAISAAVNFVLGFLSPDPIGDFGCPFSDSPRVGSALKVPDGQHGFPDIVDNYAGAGWHFVIQPARPGSSGADLYQVLGHYRGRDGVFEWIVDQGAVTRRRFIPGGTVTGFPNQRVPRP
jgi:RHS repeat-associated protein